MMDLSPETPVMEALLPSQPRHTHTQHLKHTSKALHTYITLHTSYYWANTHHHNKTTTHRRLQGGRMEAAALTFIPQSSVQMTQHKH